MTLVKKILKGIGYRWAKTFSNKYKAVGLSWADVKWLKHTKARSGLKIGVAGCDFYFRDGYELLHGIDEIFIEEVYKCQLPKEALIIDCGANMGLSVLYFKKICPDAKVIAFEPDEDNFKILEKNIKSRELQGVDLRRQAVWTADTTLNFAAEGSMSSKLETGGNVQVQAIRLANLLHQKVDFLKIDIEGAEYEVVKDIAPYLSNVSNLFLEYHGTFSQNRQIVELLDLLTNAGFRFYIKEAAHLHAHPFHSHRSTGSGFDIQLNISCFRPAGQVGNV